MLCCHTSSPPGQAALQPASHAAGLCVALGTGAHKQQKVDLADEPVAGDSTWEAMM